MLILNTISEGLQVWILNIQSHTLRWDPKSSRTRSLFFESWHWWSSNTLQQYKHSLCRKGSDATIISTLARKEYKLFQGIISWSRSRTREVKIVLRKWMDLTIYRGILCEREGTKIVNTRLVLQSSIITLWLLHIFAFESVLQSSFEFFTSIDLLVLGYLFFVGQRLSGWVVSKRLANKSAWSSSYSPGIIKSYFMSSPI